MTGFPVTLVDSGGIPFTPASKGPLASMVDDGPAVTLVASGAPPLVVDGWTPADLGDALLGQLDAEDTASITQTDGAVSAWDDTVAEVSFVQATADAQPVWSATSFNGRPGITFDGTDDQLTLASVPYPAGADPCEIWVLADQVVDASSSSQRVAFAYGTGGSVARIVRRGVISGVNRAGIGVGDGNAGVFYNNTSVDFSGIHVVRGVVGATASRCDVDGIAGTPSDVVPGTATTRSRIGATSANTAGNFWQGVINSIFVTAPLTDVQAASLRAYLGRRGGL